MSASEQSSQRISVTLIDNKAAPFYLKKHYWISFEWISILFLFMYYFLIILAYLIAITLMCLHWCRDIMLWGYVEPAGCAVWAVYLQRLRSRKRGIGHGKEHGHMCFPFTEFLVATCWSLVGRRLPSVCVCVCVWSRNINKQSPSPLFGCSTTERK